MNIIQTIDLWTEAKDNHYECFNGAFVDGFNDSNIAFDKYKVIRNCNCKIDISSKSINIKNKHHAIVFYKNENPVRLMVINKNTDVDKCINIMREDIDLNEEPIYKEDENREEIDVGSCDRWSLLYNMLKGFYTESESEYGNFSNDKYYFIPNLVIKYSLVVANEQFEIVHTCAFMNTIETRLIPIQENSLLTMK